MPSPTGFTYVVIGAGLNGASIAYHLTKMIKSGDRVIVVEKSPKGVKNSSKGASRISNRQVKNESEIYAVSSRQSDLFYQNLEQTMALPANSALLNKLNYLDAKILTAAPCYIVGNANHVEMQKTLQDVTKIAAANYEIINSNQDLFSHNKHLHLPSNEIAVIDLQAKLLNPSKATDFMLALAEQNGANICYQTKISQIIYSNSKHQITTINNGIEGILEADYLAIATNSDVADLLPQFKNIVTKEPIPVVHYLAENENINDASYLMQTPEENENLLRSIGDVRLYAMKETAADSQHLLKAGIHDRGNILPLAKTSNMSDEEILTFMKPYIENEVAKYFPALSKKLNYIKSTICYYGNTV
ncbi:MAG: FAD-dependent oxidoreductase, partial [bacterium]|nr:FAD-dependent oxidoreductase [bacterium]